MRWNLGWVRESDSTALEQRHVPVTYPELNKGGEEQWNVGGVAKSLSTLQFWHCPFQSCSELKQNIQWSVLGMRAS